MCFCLARVIVIGTRDYLKLPYLMLYKRYSSEIFRMNMFAGL